MRFLIVSLLSLAPALGAFRASVVKIDITPDKPKWLLGYGARQSTKTHDPIFHRIVALDDGQSKFVLVSTDLCLFSPTVYEEAARRVQKETGIPRLQFWWTVTHTHSAPEVGPPGVYAVLLKGRSRTGGFEGGKHGDSEQEGSPRRIRTACLPATSESHASPQVVYQLLSARMSVQTLTEHGLNQFTISPVYC